MINDFKNKIILVTGGTGTIGSGLVRHLLKYKPKQIRVLSRDDTKQYHLLEELGHPKNLRLFIGDIRDKERLLLAMNNVDTVFHAAALKHVSIGEYNPFELVKTNIIGSQNVIEAALEKGVKKVIGISTDKSVQPMNMMGITKLAMEKLFINANHYKGRMATRFSCVRFGNVAWARGSVLPVWRKQAERHRIIQVTDTKMTRFFMSQDQAVSLVLKSATLTQGGEIFVLKMPSISMGALANIFVKHFYPRTNIDIRLTANRGSEKMHEELFNDGDLGKPILENKEMFIIVSDLPIYDSGDKPLRRPGFKLWKGKQRYSSQGAVNKEAIKQIIDSHAEEV